MRLNGQHGGDADKALISIGILIVRNIKKPGFRLTDLRYFALEY